MFYEVSTIIGAIWNLVYVNPVYILCVRVMVWLEYGLCPLVFFINLEYAKNDKIHDDEVDPIFHDLKQVDFV